MKQVTIVVPKGNVNLSSITGSFEILSRANDYWQKIGNKSMFEIRIAGFETDLKLNAGFFFNTSCRYQRCNENRPADCSFSRARL